MIGNRQVYMTIDGQHRMSEIRKNSYHYKESGLDNVYLSNGFNVEETPYGTGVSIDNADHLHGAIALTIIGAPSRLRGQDVRFLRGQLDLSQKALAGVLGTTRAAIARWEGNREKQIPGAPDRALRMFYALKTAGNETAQKLLELFDEIDELEFHLERNVRRLEQASRTEFQETEHGWERALAA